MNFFEFLSDSPFIAFILICAVYYTIKHVTYTLPKCFIRHLNIRKAGWPPEHLDADGDFRPEKEKDETDSTDTP